MSNFAFLQAEWPEIHEDAQKAEAAVHVDPRASCFYARRTLELLVTWFANPTLRCASLIGTT